MAIEIFNSANSMFIIQDCPQWLNTLKAKTLLITLILFAY